MGAPEPGDLTRRGFLGHAAKLGTGFTAAAIADRFAAETLAQGARKATGHRPQRVAVIGVDHYHATSTPNYLRILQGEHVDILGVHAPDAAVAAKWAGQYSSTPYTDYRVMIDKTKPEFVVALGRHVTMPAEFRFLVETGIPFLMEKPWGIDDRTVNELADLADAKKAWAAVPMPFRYSLFAETAVEMRERGELGAISHMLFRFNQPGVQRYVDLGSPWMLSKVDAGGGALINLGIHGFDLCRYITRRNPRSSLPSRVTRSIARGRGLRARHVALIRRHGVSQRSQLHIPRNWRRPGAEVVRRESVSQGNDHWRRRRSDRWSRTRRDQAGARGLPQWWPRVVNECLNRIGRGSRRRRPLATVLVPCR